MRMILLCCAHWFEHADQPAQARFDGENSNFGTVTIEDNVYDELTETMTKVNALEALGAPQSGWPPAVRRMKVALTPGVTSRTSA